MENNTHFVPMEDRTYYDNVRARISKVGKQWRWVIEDTKGQRMAAGEEYSLKVAYQEAAIFTAAVRLWATCSRGTITPSNDGRRWFTFENTEGNRDYDTIPTRKDLKLARKLTKKLEKGKK